MTVKYGVNVQFGETIGGSPVSVDSEIPFIVGLFPVEDNNTDTYSDNMGAFGEISLVTSWDSFVSTYGDENFWGAMPRSAGWNAYKTIKHLSKTNGITPLLVYNCFDPDTHKTAITNELTSSLADDAEYKLVHPYILHGSVVVNVASGGAVKTRNTDFELRRGTDGYTYLKNISGGSLSLEVDYNYMDTTKVTNQQILDGIAKVDEVLYTAGLGPNYLAGWIHCPEFSRKDFGSLIKKADVRNAILAKCQSMSTVFVCRGLYDIDETAYNSSKVLSDLTADKSLSSEYLRACVGGGAYGTETEHLKSDWFLSAQIKAVANNGFTGVSPSNTIMSGFIPTNAFKIPEANTLRDAGLIAHTIYMGGGSSWVLWGTSTSYFSGVSTDYAKDEAVQNDVNCHLAKLLVLDTWIISTDRGLTNQRIDSILEKWNRFGKSLVGRDKLIGFEVSFNQADNPDLTTQATFRVKLLAPPTMKRTDFIVQADLTYLNSLFA